MDDSSANELSHDGSKTRPRKKGMALPEKVYRLPTSWQEAEDGDPIEVSSHGPMWTSGPGEPKLSRELLALIEAKSAAGLPWASEADDSEIVIVFRGYPDTRRGPDKGFRVF